MRLQAGDRVGSLEVVASPGHSPGHVAFLDTRDRSLIAGDVYTSFGKVAVTNHFYLRFPLAAMATFDKTQDLRLGAGAARRSIRRCWSVGHGRGGPRARRRRWTRPSPGRAGGSLMPRAGLDSEAVVAAAAALADDGWAGGG